MLSQPVAHQPFGDVDVPVARAARNDETVALVRGVFFGVVLCVPFWLAVVWVLF